MTDETTTRLKLGALLVALTVVLASGTAVAFMSAGSAAQEDDQTTSTVTAEDVEAESVQLEDVEVSGLTFQLDQIENTEDALTDSFASALGDNVEGFEAESVNVGNIESATVTVEDNTVTVDAQVESITLEGVQADSVTWDQSSGNVAQGMLLGGSLTFQSLTVEDLSVGTLTAEPGATQAPDNETTTTEETTTTTEQTTTEETTTTTEQTTTTEETTTTTETTTEADETTITTPPEDDGSEATVSFEEQTSNGTTVTVSAVSLSEDGYVAIHNDSLLEGNVVGSVVGVSEYLEAGPHENVSVTLFNVTGAEFNETALEGNQTLIAMPHMEDSGNQTYDFVATQGQADGAFISDGTAVTDDAVINVEQNQTDTTTTTTTDNQTTTTTEQNQTTTTTEQNQTTTTEA